MWVSGMSGASVANPDEGAEQREATEELRLGVRRRFFLALQFMRAMPRMASRNNHSVLALLNIVIHTLFHNLI